MEIKRLLEREHKLKQDISKQLRRGLGLQWHMIYDTRHGSVWIERHRLPFLHRQQLSNEMTPFRAFLRPEDMKFIFPSSLEYVGIRGPGVSSLYNSLVRGNYFNNEHRNVSYDHLGMPLLAGIEYTIPAKDKGKVKKLLREFSNDLDNRPKLYDIARAYG